MIQRRALATTLACLTCLAAAPPALAAAKDWKTIADVGQIGLVGLSLGRSAIGGDWQGLRQDALTLGVTAGVTTGLKYAIPEERPDHSDNKSFPSGHTSISFAAAGYLQRRYGWEIGVPATLAAGVVALARVKSRDHHWYDVVAGAALGEGAAWLFTRPRDSAVQIWPWAASGGGGLALAARF